MSSQMLTQSFLDPAYFEDLKSRALSQLKAGEHPLMNLSAENSQFIRINGAKVRQTGTVEDATLELTMILETEPKVLRKSTHGITLTGISYQDLEEIRKAIEALRAETAQLPQDPYAILPVNHGSSRVKKKGKLLSIDEAPEKLLQSVEKIDIAGIYASGTIVRAMANSAGLTHWFSTETFSFDYSLSTPTQKALKGTFAGTEWNQAGYEAEMKTATERLTLLEQPSKKLERGSYRTYLAPAAIAEFISMFSWGAIGEASIRQGDSPLIKLRKNEARFSPKFSLSEDFTGGETPRFNSEGELTAERLPLIQQGRLANTLVSSRSAQEYGVPANGASAYEGMRSPAVNPGSLQETEILKRLGTGLYLSNLHYLNWSDQHAGRITGMTRYACFWVENGQIVAPIENLRFDDTLFRLFGEALEDLTTTQSYLPDVNTYFARGLGGMKVPGAILASMQFTL